jgi:membrane fusion protein, multidrug efflux system
MSMTKIEFENRRLKRSGPPLQSMRRCRRALRALVGAAVLSCGLAASGVAQQPGPEAAPVGTVTAERKPIARTADFVGRVQAVEHVDIQARITGFLEQVLFKEGEFIKAQQPLYRIEPDQFKAAVNQAQGALEASKAKKLLTAIQFERAEQLMKTNAGTVVARDQALTADRSAAAQILIDQANLETATINLGYTDIVSPISGKIGRTMVTKGNVVSPQSGTLTTIVSQDPMYVLFPVSQRALMRARKDANKADIAGIKVKLRFADGSAYGPVGQIDFIDVTVDKATDTVQVRAVFSNSKGELIDGQLVTVNLEAGTLEEQVVVPQAALVTDQQGIYVFIVEGGKVAIRRIKTGGADGQGVIVAEGLSGGEQVVVEGIQSLRPGMPVKANPAVPNLNQG